MFVLPALSTYSVIVIGSASAGVVLVAAVTAGIIIYNNKKEKERSEYIRAKRLQQQRAASCDVDRVVIHYDAERVPVQPERNYAPMPTYREEEEYEYEEEEEDDAESSEYEEEMQAQGQAVPAAYYGTPYSQRHHYVAVGDEEAVSPQDATYVKSEDIAPGQNDASQEQGLNEEVIPDEGNVTFPAPSHRSVQPVSTAISDEYVNRSLQASEATSAAAATAAAGSSFKILALSDTNNTGGNVDLAEARRSRSAEATRTKHPSQRRRMSSWSADEKFDSRQSRGDAGQPLLSGPPDRQQQSAEFDASKSNSGYSSQYYEEDAASRNESPTRVAADDRRQTSSHTAYSTHPSKQQNEMAQHRFARSPPEKQAPSHDMKHNRAKTRRAVRDGSETNQMRPNTKVSERSAHERSSAGASKPTMINATKDIHESDAGKESEEFYDDYSWVHENRRHSQKLSDEFSYNSNNQQQQHQRQQQQQQCRALQHNSPSIRDKKSFAYSYLPDTAGEAETSLESSIEPQHVNRPGEYHITDTRSTDYGRIRGRHQERSPSRIYRRSDDNAMAAPADNGEGGQPESENEYEMSDYEHGTQHYYQKEAHETDPRGKYDRKHQRRMVSAESKTQRCYTNPMESMEGANADKTKYLMSTDMAPSSKPHRPRRNADTVAAEASDVYIDSQGRVNQVRGYNNRGGHAADHHGGKWLEKSIMESHRYPRAVDVQ